MLRISCVILILKYYFRAVVSVGVLGRRENLGFCNQLLCLNAKISQYSKEASNKAGDELCKPGSGFAWVNNLPGSQLSKVAQH